jgi:hypothetical protein
VSCLDEVNLVLVLVLVLVQVVVVQVVVVVADLLMDRRDNLVPF